MKAGEVTFQSLLDGKVQYQVPLFQRTYNWGEDEWQKIWEDVLEIYAMEEPRNHFIGAIVTQPVGDPAGQTTKYLLIDGQQRFTTLLIILACIRKQAEDREDIGDLANEIWETCLVNKFSTGTDFNKLRPTQRDRQPLADVLSGTNGNYASQVGTALAFFTRKLSDGDLNDNPLDLRRLKLCVTDRLDLVSINLESGDSPHRIFESLNNTGMQLGASDLVRNLLFMNLPNEDEAQLVYDKHWFPMQEATADNLDDFFWRYLMMDGSLPRWDETFEEIKKQFEKQGSQAVPTLVGFSKYAHYYRWLSGIAEAPQGKALRDQIKRLNDWELSVAYPFLMKSFELLEGGEIDPNDLLLVMQIIESFVVRRAVCTVPTNRLRRVFARMYAQVDPTNFVVSSRNYLLEENWPSDEVFKERFVWYPVYSPSRLTRTRLILESLEKHLEDSLGIKETPTITDQISVEHVMPRTLTDEWKGELGSNWKNIYDQWLHTPGNLTLTAYNPELSNAPFSKKISILTDTGFALTKDILSCGNWNEITIKSRGEALADRAAVIWKR